MSVINGGVLPHVMAVAYLVAATLFILGLKKLSSPKTARGGNMLGALGMLIAILATLLDRQILSFEWIILGIIVGSAIGAIMAYTVKMTAMPQMVGIFNGFGGGASLVVALEEFLRTSVQPFDVSLTIMLSILIGGVTFSGSMVAAGKLQEVITGRAVTYPGQRVFNGLVAAVIVGISAYLIATQSQSIPAMMVLIGLALVFGVLFTIPIGGADMPVVISLLNSFSGLAAASTGFVLRSNALIISGALVGASGIILTNIMCKAMNRSLANVLFSAFGSQITATGVAAEGKSIRSVSAEDAAILLGYARSVLFVPGYGVAVSQAQHQVQELGELLQQRGIDVKYAVHPVAGRMPGHLNVILSEANVEYDALITDTDEANSYAAQADVAVVIGANDVVNPDAERNPSSPLFGMPIIDAYKAGTVIVMKRSMNPGFAGVDNPLFFEDNTRMLFGDAKKSVQEITKAFKAGVVV